MENKELETWLAETKAKNLSLGELKNFVGLKNSYSNIEIYKRLKEIFNASNSNEVADFLFNQWQKEPEFSPKRGDRVLVWNDSENEPNNRIFLAEIKGSELPIIVVNRHWEDKYSCGQPFETTEFKNMKPLPTELPTETDFKSKVIELIEKTIKEYGEAKETAIDEGDYGDAAKYILIKETFEVFLKVVKEQLC